MDHNLQDTRGAIVEAHSRTVWRIALSHTRRVDAAEEVFQEVFLRFFEKEREFQNDEHLKAWLIRTTLICCKRYQSALYQHTTLNLEEIRSLAALPEKYRLPIQLHFMEGLSAEECAHALGLRLGTFRMRLTRGKRMLKELLKGEGIDV